MTFVILLALTFLGFLSLARSQRKYRLPEGWFAGWSIAQLRGTGVALLALSAILSMTIEGVGYGLLLWSLILTVGAMAVAVHLARHTAKRGRYSSSGIQ